MCLGVFIASDKPLSLVPWDAQTPGFNTTPLSGPEENVRQQFSLPEIVYAGAHTRCSCGFRSDRDDLPAVIRSREALVAYLREAAGPVPSKSSYAGKETTRRPRSCNRSGRSRRWPAGTIGWRS